MLLTKNNIKKFTQLSRDEQGVISVLNCEWPMLLPQDKESSPEHIKTFGAIIKAVRSEVTKAKKKGIVLPMEQLPGRHVWSDYMSPSDVEFFYPAPVPVYLFEPKRFDTFKYMLLRREVMRPSVNMLNKLANDGSIEVLESTTSHLSQIFILANICVLDPSVISAYIGGDSFALSLNAVFKCYESRLFDTALFELLHESTLYNKCVLKAVTANGYELEELLESK